MLCNNIVGPHRDERQPLGFQPSVQLPPIRWSHYYSCGEYIESFTCCRDCESRTRRLMAPDHPSHQRDLIPINCGNSCSRHNVVLVLHTSAKPLSYISIITSSLSTRVRTEDLEIPNFADYQLSHT